MNKQQIFEEILDIQILVFSQDDMLDQDVLFQVQDKIANLSLAIANSSQKNVSNLVTRFPWLYQKIKE